MIAFVTLLLGLVTGPRTVELAVAEGVAAVELRLDGERVGRRTAAPWSFECDFGDRLTAHRLVAVALDGAGGELARAEQLVNLPRAQVESELALEEWRGGRPARARLIWRSVEGLEPESIAVELDGATLAVEDPARIALPAVDPWELHLLTAELTFPGNLRAAARAVFGGPFGAAVETELTAVAVRPRERQVTRPEEARGWLVGRDGSPLVVVAVDRGPAEVLFVRDAAAQPALARLESLVKKVRGRTYKSLGLAEADRILLVASRAEAPGPRTVASDMFAISTPFGLAEAPLPRALARFQLVGETASEQRLTEALAVAGVRAAAGGRRRAVVLVLSGCAATGGHWPAENVRRYLAELRVPLVVWTTGRRDRRADDDLCRDAIAIDRAGRYVEAIGALRRELDEQQILWVEGRHLPREIRVAAGAGVAELAALPW